MTNEFDCEQKANAIIGKWKRFFGNTDDKILQLYMQRKRDCLKCLYEGMTDEQAQKETAHYQDEINGLQKYCRLFVRRNGYDIYIGEGKWAHISDEPLNELNNANLDIKKTAHNKTHR